ncbi:MULTISPECIES: PTS system mannose/fructose/sorbose family transporter subunit IID [Fusobacterium]|uniref:PTS system mannose/fructose/sorbose family transporter subunit IID n=1 Tax=Fusobacterium TaxID=848 RepID=UPI0008A3DAC7|nr:MULTISPECIES: PTS system mannose/fructose/sorbose family transporter subunit IID [Fusobacterium]OFL92708.1 PTS fructose transporter subunit IID [Fusobacterium sp. HMSC073F01]
MENTNENRIISKKELRKSWFIWYLGAEVSNSYERLQSLIFCASMVPVLKKLYTTKESLSEALKRHLSFFNTEGIAGSIVQGITIAMEEQRAASNDSSQDVMITSIKTGLMGPVAGIGDSIVWAAIMPIIIALFLPFAIQGSSLGAIMPIILYTGISMFIGYFLCVRGYTIGRNSILQLLQNGKIKDLIEGAAVLGLFMMGALAASYITIKTPLEIAVKNSQPIVLQQILDSIVPGLLELTAVFAIYFYMKKKGPNYNVIMGAILVLSIVASVLGIL